MKELKTDSDWRSSFHEFGIGETCNSRDIIISEPEAYHMLDKTERHDKSDISAERKHVYPQTLAVLAVDASCFSSHDTTPR